MIDPLAAKNVVDASSKFRGGLESLEGLGLKNLDNVRAKSGLGERQVTEAASDTSPLMSKLENRIGDFKNAKAPINELENYTASNGDIVKNLIDKKFGAGYFGDEAATGIMASVR